MANGKPGRPSNASVIANLQAQVEALKALIEAQATGNVGAKVANSKVDRRKGKPGTADNLAFVVESRNFRGQPVAGSVQVIFADDNGKPGKPSEYLLGLCRQWVGARFARPFGNLPGRWYGPEAGMPAELRSAVAAWRKAFGRPHFTVEEVEAQS